MSFSLKSLYKGVRVAYIHARPHGHPIHEAYARSLKPDRYFIDFALRWHDVQRPAFIRYLSWVLCAFLLPHKRKYDVFYADGPVHFLAIMRSLGLIGKRQKIIYLMADETLYFMHNNYYGKVAGKALLWVLQKADGYICIGKQQELLLTQIFPKVTAYKTIANGISDVLYTKLANNSPDFLSRRIVCIANVGDSDIRSRYKGLDYLPMIINDLQYGLEVVVIGDVSQRIQNLLHAQISSKTSQLIFVGKTDCVEEHLQDAFMCIHPARGEAWGISVLECMRAGLPVLVSEDTGAKEVVAGLGQEWILPPQSFLSHIHRFYKSPHSVKIIVSDKARALTNGRTLSLCTEQFSQAFQELVAQLHQS